MANDFFNPPNLFNTLQYGFSQVATAQGGRTVYLSGQVAWNEKQEIVGGDDLGLQTRQALENVGIGMQAAGGSLADVVSMRIYIVEKELGETSSITAALKDYFPADRAPSTTWIGVYGLARPEFLIEIEAIGVIP